MSLIACAVLKAEFGYHTCPAWLMVYHTTNKQVNKRHCKQVNNQYCKQVNKQCKQEVLTRLSVSGLAGSAGITHSTVLVSTAMTPQGIPPSLALPVTTVCAQLLSVSMKVPLSKNPPFHLTSPTGDGGSRDVVMAIGGRPPTTARLALNEKFGVVGGLGGRVLHWPGHGVQTRDHGKGGPLHLGGHRGNLRYSPSGGRGTYLGDVGQPI